MGLSAFDGRKSAIFRSTSMLSDRRCLSCLINATVNWKHWSQIQFSCSIDIPFCWRSASFFSNLYLRYALGQRWSSKLSWRESSVEPGITMFFTSQVMREISSSNNLVWSGFLAWIKWCKYKNCSHEKTLASAPLNSTKYPLSVVKFATPKFLLSKKALVDLNDSSNAPNTSFLFDYLVNADFPA